MQPENGQPEHWRTRRARSRWWSVPFHALEWGLEWLVYGLKRLAIVELLQVLAVFSVAVSLLTWFAERGDRRRDRLYRTWEIIAAAKDDRVNGARNEALEDLASRNFSMAGLSVPDSAWLERVDLRGADLGRAQLSGVRLAGADLGCRGILARWSRRWSRCVDLSAADLRHADLRGADLTGANLNEADLTGADLRGVCLAGAWLFSVRLDSAKLANAQLPHAYLNGAEMRGIAADQWPSFVGTVYEALVMDEDSSSRDHLRGGFEPWQMPEENDYSDSQEVMLKEIGKRTPIESKGPCVGRDQYFPRTKEVPLY
jgi:hypothetical protein